MIVEGPEGIEVDVLNKTLPEAKEKADCLCPLGNFWHWRLADCIHQGSWGYECGFFPMEHHHRVCQDYLKCQDLPGHAGAQYLDHGDSAKAQSFPASCNRCEGIDNCLVGQARQDEECLKSYEIDGAEACVTLKVTTFASAVSEATATFTASATVAKTANAKVQVTSQETATGTAKAKAKASQEAEVTVVEEAFAKATAQAKASAFGKQTAEASETRTAEATAKQSAEASAEAEAKKEASAKKEVTGEAGGIVVGQEVKAKETAVAKEKAVASG
jgi:hypothetical protein